MLGQPDVERSVGLIRGEGSDDEDIPVTSVAEESACHLVAGIVFRLKVPLARPAPALREVEAPASRLDLQGHTFLPRDPVEAVGSRIYALSIQQLTECLTEHGPMVPQTGRRRSIPGAGWARQGAAHGIVRSRDSGRRTPGGHPSGTGTFGRSAMSRGIIGGWHPGAGVPAVESASEPGSDIGADAAP